MRAVLVLIVRQDDGANVAKRGVRPPMRGPRRGARGGGDPTWRLASSWSRTGGRHSAVLAVSFFADDSVQAASIGTPLRGRPSPREHVPVTMGARGQPMPGDVGRKPDTSVRWVARLGGSSGVRATWSSRDGKGLGLAGVPVGRAVLHKSTGSVCQEVLVALVAAGRPG
jgi:hypothetical protein